MSLFLVVSVIVIASAAADDNCDVSKYITCMEPIHNVTFGHQNGLFQDSNDLATSCPIIKTGIKCIKDFATECGTDMIAENFHEQFERPAEFLTKICDSDSPLRTEYLKASPCLQEHSDDLEVCSTKVQEFLAMLDDADTNEKEMTMTCMYEMMLRACLLSTGAEKCQLETASFIRKALLYSPSLGMQTCSKE
ncbi:HSF_DOMAIN domain-containing protein [Trichonephila inaurata madagascariensis]|uniref:HSF_DOMAIN domain-containing protein n=1 Tax=Trichonephila inaurata madagascariensis TaxID=2747483 RepID=A0A8X7BV82_9ARAC|nr:HSF_DOMAIN domain-containing protein [Trichonephila inaurata madagascariensis]